MALAPFQVFRGNCPHNVSRDAKYAVKYGDNGKSVVALTYRSHDGERWYMTSEDHPELVNIVNQVKISLGSPHGSFYINEFKQVIVPSTGDREYYLAGKYVKPLRFEFEGKILSGEPVDLQNNPLRPGDEWVGPHPGIPYKLCAGGRDIKYTIEVRPNVERDMMLSTVIGSEAAKEVASRIVAVRGFEGGRFYVNEFCAMFTPVTEGYDITYYYLGQLDLNKWFPVSHQ